MIYPLLDGTTRGKRGELGRVHLPQSSTPNPSSMPVLKRVGNPHETEVLPGDAHPRNLKPSPGAPGQITASRRFPVQPELLERKGSRPTALFGICYFILCLLGRCDCSFWLVVMKTRLKAQPCPRLRVSCVRNPGEQKEGLGMDSQSFISLWHWFP